MCRIILDCNVPRETFRRLGPVRAYPASHSFVAGAIEPGYFALQSHPARVFYNLPQIVLDKLSAGPRR
jgi:hypothetical protein